MLYILPFCRRSDIYQWDWLKKGESVKFIVPHPKLADSIRETVESHRLDLNIESTTIADFIKSEILHRDSDIKIYKKYQLILELSTVWKKYFPASTYDEFFGVFDEFTQLRGITIDFGLVEEILDNSYLGFVGRDIEGIKKFWKYLEIREIYDEHAACFHLAKQYGNTVEKGTSKKIIIYGFSHLSSGQCDLLNIMGKFHDIYIPVYANVWREVVESDWLKWLDAKIMPVSSNERKLNKVSLIKINNNGLSSAIRQLAENYCKDKAVEIILAQKNPDLFHIGELAWGEVSFKVEASVFDNTYKKIFNDLEDGFDWKKEIDTETVLVFLRGIIQAELEKSFEEKNFKTIKMASFVCDEIEKWMNLSEANSIMKMFDYDVFKNSLKLNLPRNYILPQMDKNIKTGVKGLEDIEAVGTDNLVVICATSSYSDFDFKEDHWVENMVEAFLKIGPIKRKELEFKMLKESIVDILVEREAFLVVEENLLEESLLWSEVLSDFTLDEIFIERQEKKEKIDYIKNLGKKNYSPSESEKWSSGKIQKYLDCPRAFYYNYVVPVHISPQNHQEVEARELGSLQHKIVCSFLEQFDTLDEEKYHGLVKDTWDQFLERKKLFLNDLNYWNHFIEIKNYSWRGIKSLLNIKKSYPDAKFSFEVEFFSQVHKGSIDCIVNLGNGMMGIIDFKRSDASIPGKREVFDFKKIQIWYYMHNLKREGFRSCFLGYLCLAELEKSQFVFDKDVLSMDGFKNIFPVGKKYSCSFQEKEKQFERFLAEKIENILEDKNFSPIPQSNKICNYCWMEKVCINRDGAISEDG